LRGKINMNSKIYTVIGLILVFIGPGISISQVLNPTASFLGTHSSERVGYHIHTAGDVNSDGYDDFLIGTFHNRTRGQDAGAAYLILGKEAADWGYKNSLTSADARILGGSRYEAVGYYLGGGGDVNGDGYDDFLIGAPAGNDAVPQNPGHLYLIFGKTSADWGYNYILPSSAGASFDGENQSDHAGQSVAMIGDLNGDGYDDIICGAPYNDYGSNDAGKVYIILGKSGGWQQGVNLNQSDASFYGTWNNGLVGYAVDGVGDVNNDGILDFAIGARGEGKVYLFFGRQSVDWGFNCNINQADIIFTKVQYDDWTGWRVSKAGDVNSDGFDDLLIGAPKYNYNGDDTGKVYLILGRSSGWPGNLSNADASFIGEAENDQAGWDVQDAGDVNGDGYDDFLIGAWYNDSNGENSGKMYLIKGKSSGWQQNVSLSQIPDTFVGEHAGDYAGFSVAAAGDVNGDGLSDIMTSSTYNGEAYNWAGKILLFTADNPSPVLSVSPLTLNFGLTLTSLNFSVSNNGGQVLDWSLNENPDQSWITSVSPTTGSLTNGENQTVTVTVDRLGLNQGMHNATITITSNGGTMDLSVNIRVPEKPDAVNDLSINSEAGNSIQLSWSVSDSAVSYNIYCGTTPFFSPDIPKFNTTDLTYVDNNITGDPGTNYYYGITAVNAAGESEISNRIGEFDYELITTAATNFNEIALPLVTGISKASELMNLIPNCTSIARWDAASQGYEQYVDWLPPTDFDVEPGYPYYVDVSSNSIFTLMGEYSNPSFNLITTAATNFNEIMLPLNRGSITLASELLNNIPNCTSIARWDASSQGYEQYVDWLPPTNFNVKVGYPYYVDITDNTIWPSGLAKNISAAPISGDEPLKLFQCSVPHLVYGKINLSPKIDLSDVHFKAYILSRKNELVNNQCFGCKILDDGLFLVQCASFPSRWKKDEIMRIDFYKNKDVWQTYNATLTYNSADKATLLSVNPNRNPDKFEIANNYPNPFNAETLITYKVPTAGHVELAVYNMLGQKIRTLINKKLSAGAYHKVWDSKADNREDVASGVYFIRVISNNKQQIKKMILIR